jgi:exodeoxyribonuclease V beta subunit
VARVGTGASPRFVIVDYKTNLLAHSSTYEADDLVVEMSASGYPLQGLLYQVALHRYLRGRLDAYDPAQHLGGVCYFYVRGAARARSATSGLALWRIPAVATTTISDLLDGVTQ